MPRPQKQITVDQLSLMFHLPIKEVSEKLGICASVIQKFCRLHGIKRWPHRKIQSLDRKIDTVRHEIQTTAPALPYTKEELEQQMYHLIQQRTSMLRNLAVKEKKQLNANTVNKNSSHRYYHSNGSSNGRNENTIMTMNYESRSWKIQKAIKKWKQQKEQGQQQKQGFSIPGTTLVTSTTKYLSTLASTQMITVSENATISVHRPETGLITTSKSTEQKLPSISELFPGVPFKSPRTQLSRTYEIPSTQDRTSTVPRILEPTPTFNL